VLYTKSIFYPVIQSHIWDNATEND